jgi:hypothetical protein
LRLPFVHCGLAGDLWAGLDRYLRIEPAGSSTFFVIPVRDDPGRTHDGLAPGWRAARYGARDLAPVLARLASAGCEIGVHGIDAWLDQDRGREELREISRLTGSPDVGVRMHWLYGDDKSPAILEEAGFTYDSTSGYNETIGYRAGTTQVFRPPGTTRLLELPLHVMDTALFYPRHLDVSPAEARERVRGIITHARCAGGTVTLNWHDRSIAPERLWGRAYSELIRDLQDAGAWFPTASQAVSWFRKRRSATFQSVTWEPGRVHVEASLDGGCSLPGLRLRVRRPRACRNRWDFSLDPWSRYVDLPMNGNIDAVIAG